jgi:hypothetical protein
LTYDFTGTFSILDVFDYNNTIALVFEPPNFLGGLWRLNITYAKKLGLKFLMIARQPFMPIGKKSYAEALCFTGISLRRALIL